MNHVDRAQSLPPQQQQQMMRKESTGSIMSIGGSSTTSETNNPHQNMLNEEEEEEDRKYYDRIKAAFRVYRSFCNERVNKTEKFLNTLPERHQNMLASYRNHLRVLRDCIDANQAVIRKLIRGNLLGSYTRSTEDVNNGDLGGLIMQRPQEPSTNGKHITSKVTQQDMDFVQTTLKLIARDWSAAGEEERQQSYNPIIEAIMEFFDPNEYDVSKIKIVVPGAGLGRLVYELACRGFECEGNEYSFFMLQASQFVLNECSEENNYTLYPWVHQFVNTLRMDDQIASVRFPDVCPAKNPPKGKIMMAAGDFLKVYKDPNWYDCVATCFFIDCANNIIDFIETIFLILVPGGIWVNLGPLLYHYSDIEGEDSIEPTFENLVSIMETVGFEILRSKTGVHTKYAQNPRSMLKSEYESLFWICRKPINAVNFDVEPEPRRPVRRVDSQNGFDFENN